MLAWLGLKIKGRGGMGGRAPPPKAQKLTTPILTCSLNLGYGTHGLRDTKQIMH